MPLGKRFSAEVGDPYFILFEAILGEANVSKAPDTARGQEHTELSSTRALRSPTDPCDRDRMPGYSAVRRPRGQGGEKDAD